MFEHSLTGGVVWVTGASSGIGAACARRFAALGANVIGTARREARVDALAAEIEAADGVRTLAAALDVRDADAVAAFVAGLEGPWAAIDVLVNNAGLARGLEKFHEGDLADWNEMVDTNLKGVLHVCRAVLPKMLARGRGHVINLGSLAAIDVYPGGNVYCASKLAVEGLTRALQMEYVDTPLRFTAIHPGLVETEFSLVRFHGDADRARKPYAGIVPLTADDVADAIVWAATRPARVNVGAITLTPVHQAGSTRVHRME
jgi:NADP-dependent 3-hydroxy acid dehydrogenase YdfG